MTRSSLFIAGIACIAAAPLQAQDAAPSPETPRGTYFVFGEEDGAVFVSFEPALAADNQWPLTFFYYAEGGEFTGAVRMRANGDCAARETTAYLTDRLGEDGAAVPIAIGTNPPPFRFAASEEGGAAAIVSFICGDANQRLAQASAPIFATPAATARRYVALRQAGIGERLARDLSIRDPETNEALIATAIPEEQREAVRTILAGQ